MTKENYTHIGFVMDRSGSMGSMSQEATVAFNRFVEEQRKVEGEATFTFVDFDSEYRVIHDFVSLDEVEEYTLVPRDVTALLDAVGRTINTVGEKLAAMDEADRPSKVIIAVLTDGHENASQEFTREQVRALIKEHEDKYSWTFVYLGANQDAFTVAQSMGISGGNAINFASTGFGVASGVSTINKAFTAYRSMDYDLTVKGSVLSMNQANDDEMLS